MRVVVLGSGGWIPSEVRHTASYLVDTRESLIILDTGTGLSRLRWYPELLDQYREIHIIYSHYHLDHLSGISYISNWTKNKYVTIHGPGKSLGFPACKDVMEGLIKPPYYPHFIHQLAEKVQMEDYDLNGFQIGSTPIRITAQTHSGKSFGIAIGDAVHYATDTIPLEESFRVAEGKKLLLHECWSILGEGSKDHSSFEEISSLLKRYNIERLGLIHINPNWKADEFKTLAAVMSSYSQIFVVEDGMEFSL